MRIRLLLAGLLLAASTQAQTAPPASPEQKIYTYVEQMPQPPGGMEGLMQYLRSNVQYPAEALRQGIEGKVYVNYVVSETGAPEQIQVLKGAHPLLDAEALRVFRTMPAWTPGKQAGRPVKVTLTTPLTFVLPAAPPVVAQAPPAPEYPFDEAAKYPGGPEAMLRFTGAKLRYPARAQAENARGKVFVRFLVDSTGQVREPVVVRGVHPLLDAEAVRVVQLMPKWKPARYQGHRVPMSFTLPFTFGSPY